MKFLWCCHVRGPDDVLAAPDYATALAWSDQLLEIDRDVDHSDADRPFLSAVPAPWPYSEADHAANIKKSADYFGNSFLKLKPE
jgi:hypothetical protein